MVDLDLSSCHAFHNRQHSLINLKIVLLKQSNGQPDTASNSHSSHYQCDIWRIEVVRMVRSSVSCRLRHPLLASKIFVHHAHQYSYLTNEFLDRSFHIRVFPSIISLSLSPFLFVSATTRDPQTTQTSGCCNNTSAIRTNQCWSVLIQLPTHRHTC